MLKLIDWLENYFHPEPKHRIDRWKPRDFIELTNSTMACLDCNALSNTENGCQRCGSHALLPVEIRGKKSGAILHSRHMPQTGKPSQAQEAQVQAALWVFWVGLSKNGRS